jgi:hypothetical protein
MPTCASSMASTTGGGPVFRCNHQGNEEEDGDETRVNALRSCRLNYSYFSELVH